MAKNRRPGFYIVGKKGFHIVFENGWTVSVQFGPGNYCENYDRRIGHDEEACGRDGSGDAETAVWGPDGGMIDRGDGGTVQGHQSPAQVFELLQFAASGGVSLSTGLPSKGVWGGECERTACSNTGAWWFNRSTLKHYCGPCAERLNDANSADAARLFGGPLCIRVASPTGSEARNG